MCVKNYENIIYKSQVVQIHTSQKFIFKRCNALDLEASFFPLFLYFFPFCFSSRRSNHENNGEFKMKNLNTKEKCFKMFQRTRHKNDLDTIFVLLNLNKDKDNDDNNDH